MKYYLEDSFCFLNGEIGIAIIEINEDDGCKTAYTVEIDNDNDYKLLDAIEGVNQNDIDIEFLEEVTNVYFA